MTIKQKTPTNPLLQLLITFVIPIVILTKFSGPEQLGPTKGFLLALAVPVIYELYNVVRYKKYNVVSLLAIGGIVVTGAIGLLGLSEGWLALRRSVPYVAIAAAISISIWIKRPLVDLALPQIFDIDAINTAAKHRHTTEDIAKTTRVAGYVLSGIFLLVAVASYALTIVVITSPTDTAGFNQEYARLRVLGLPAITAPLIVGMFGVVFYVMRRLEQLTGLEIDQLVKKR